MEIVIALCSIAIVCAIGGVIWTLDKIADKLEKIFSVLRLVK